MKGCDCFHTQLDITLMNITKFQYQERFRPCEIGLDGMYSRRWLGLC